MKKVFILIISFLVLSCDLHNQEPVFENPIFNQPMRAQSNTLHDMKITPDSELDLETGETTPCKLLENTQTSILLKCETPKGLQKERQKLQTSLPLLKNAPVAEYRYERYTRVIYADNYLNNKDDCIVVNQSYADFGQKELSAAGMLFISRENLPNRDCGPAENWEHIYNIPYPEF